MDLRNPFGLRDNQIILIEDIPKDQNGLRCNCVCPACKEPFEARMGDVRRHHFAHSGQGCDEVNAYLTGLYMLLNEYISTKQPLHLPPVIVGFELSAYSYLTEANIYEHITLLSASEDEAHEIKLFDSTKIRFDTSQIITSTNKRPKAIIASLHGKELAIRITPPDTVCKFGEVSKYQDYPTVEIDLSDAAEMLQKSNKDDVFKYLMNQQSIYRWIYNPIITKAFPKIIKRSKAYYDAAQERMKKEAEERRIKAEQARQEAEKRRKEREERQKAEAAERKRQAEERRYIKEHGYEIGLSDVRDLFTQQDTIIRDRFGNRWVKCEKCGAIKQDHEFASYGGTNHVNLGTCRDCSRKQ